MKIRYEAGARADVIEAVSWYADVAGWGIADAFERELDTVVQLLVRHPQIGAPGRHGTRHLNMDRFPYTLHYRIDGNALRIVAVASQSRRPGYWRKR